MFVTHNKWIELFTGSHTSLANPLEGHSYQSPASRHSYCSREQCVEDWELFKKSGIMSVHRFRFVPHPNSYTSHHQGLAKGGPETDETAVTLVELLNPLSPEERAVSVNRSLGKSKQNSLFWDVLSCPDITLTRLQGIYNSFLLVQNHLTGELDCNIL